MNSVHQSDFFYYFFTNPASSVTVKYFQQSVIYSHYKFSNQISFRLHYRIVSSIQLQHTAQHFSSEPFTGETIAVTPCEVRTNGICRLASRGNSFHRLKSWMRLQHRRRWQQGEMLLDQSVM